MLRSERNVKRLSGAPEDSRVVFITASGTGAMEASVISIFGSSDKLLVIDGGSFGKRFAQICEVHRIRHEVIRLDFGERLSEHHLAPHDGKGFTGLLINIHETTTGQIYDMSLVSEFCKKNGMVLVVDAISSFLADRLNVAESSIDAMIFSSQKALALSPGLSGIVLSGRACERINEKPPGTVYLDLKAHLKDMERGQTPFTPAVGIMLEMDDMLKRVCETGVHTKVERTRELAVHFRERVIETGLKLPDYPLSNALTPLIFEKGNAAEVYRKLREEHEITLTPNGGPLKDKVLRVGHMGNITERDLDLLIDKLKEVLQ
jgi:aspartate aminotransferase-like enzyme